MNIPNFEQPVVAGNTVRHFNLLSEIVNDNIFMFYAPKERFTSKKLLDFYGRYKRWFSNLPQSLHLRDITTPHVLVLQ